MSNKSIAKAAGIRRRRFLQTTSAGAAVIAAPAIISPKALASSGEIETKTVS